MQTSPVPIG